MKTWNNPEFVSLEINATANHQNGNNLGKMCKYFSDIPCNAQGNGKGICKNCEYNVGDGSSVGGDTDIMS